MSIVVCNNLSEQRCAGATLEIIEVPAGGRVSCGLSGYRMYDALGSLRLDFTLMPGESFTIHVNGNQIHKGVYQTS